MGGVRLALSSIGVRGKMKGGRGVREVFNFNVGLRFDQAKKLN